MVCLLATKVWLTDGLDWTGGRLYRGGHIVAPHQVCTYMNRITAMLILLVGRQDTRDISRGGIPLVRDSTSYDILPS